MARRTNRPAVLIAGRRLSDNPRAAFAISGLIVALFATTVSVGVITTIVGYAGIPGGGSRDTLIQEFLRPSAPGGSGPSSASVPDGLLTALHSVPGVRGVTVVHDTGLGRADQRRPLGRGGLMRPAHCHPGAWSLRARSPGRRHHRESGRQHRHQTVNPGSHRVARRRGLPREAATGSLGPRPPGTSDGRPAGHRREQPSRVVSDG